MDLIITILPVVTKDLPISPRFCTHLLPNIPVFSTVPPVCAVNYVRSPAGVVLEDFQILIPSFDFNILLAL